VRRTARTIIISTIHRIFNKEAMDELARRVADPNQKEKAKKARRVEGRLRIELLIDNLNTFTTKVSTARLAAGTEKCREIFNQITGKKFKMSETDRKNKIKKFKENIKKKRTEVKAEMAAGVDMTPTMDGGVLLRILNKKNSCTACCKDPTRDCNTEHCAMAAVHAEISKRKMKMRKGWKKTLGIKEKRHAIRDDELQNIALDGDKIKQGYDKTRLGILYRFWYLHTMVNCTNKMSMKFKSINLYLLSILPINTIRCAKASVSLTFYPKKKFVVPQNKCALLQRNLQFSQPMSPHWWQDFFRTPSLPSPAQVQQSYL